LKSPSLLSVKKLNVTISNSTILKKISFELQKNEILGFVGESGSGKSITAFSIINLFNSKKLQQNGKIFFNGDRIDSMSNKEFEKIRGSQISMIFQEPMSSLNPSMKCGNQVLETILKHKIIKPKKGVLRVLDLFQKVRLKNPKVVFKKYPHELSGGQQQRVMIAIAISCNPKILIADEPTTSLDGIVKEEIICLLKEIQEKTKMSVIFVSHDLNLVSKFANNIIVLNKGVVVESGETSHVFNNPQNAYTKMLLNSRTPKKIRPVRLPTIENKLKKYPLISKKDREERHQKIYSKEALLKVKNLSFSYNEKLILSNVNFSIFKGETLGLIGESGSGKSTIVKSILNINNYSKGEIFYKNIDIKKYNNIDFRKSVQLVFQDPYSSLNPEIRIGNSIMEPMIAHQIYKNDEERSSKVNQLLEDVGLQKSDFKKYPSEFSGGQRQRIVIARALSLSPDVLICDESVSALDVSVKAQVLNLLNRLKEKFSFTFLFISHDLSIIKYMCDRVIILNKGVIEEVSETDKLFKNPHRNYTKKLLKANGY
jgi:peptide/nickel transport system ATP-binding protein